MASKKEQRMTEQNEIPAVETEVQVTEQTSGAVDTSKLYQKRVEPGVYQVARNYFDKNKPFCFNATGERVPVRTHLKITLPTDQEALERLALIAAKIDAGSELSEMTEDELKATSFNQPLSINWNDTEYFQSLFPEQFKVKRTPGQKDEAVKAVVAYLVYKVGNNPIPQLGNSPANYTSVKAWKAAQPEAFARAIAKATEARGETIDL